MRHIEELCPFPIWRSLCPRPSLIAPRHSVRGDPPPRPGGHKRALSVAARQISAVGGVLGKFVEQAPRRLRNRNFAVQDFPAGDTGAVHGFVSALVGLHDGAIHADPGKSPFAARIAQDLRIEFMSVPAAACLPTGPAATVASAPILNLSLSRLCKAWSFINSITTSVKEPPIWKPTLPPPTAKKHRSTPAMGSAAGRQSLAVAAAKYEGGLLLSWNDGNAFRRFQQFLGNALVRRSHDLLEDLGSFLNAPNVIAAIRRQSGQDQTQARDRNDQQMFGHDFLL